MTMTSFRAKPQVTRVKAATQAEALQQFSAKLTLETDPSEVHFDMKNDVDDFILIDVRSEKHFEECHIPNAVSLPHSRISERTTGLFDKDKLIVTYCWGPACNGATNAALKFAKLGFAVKEMIGGIEYWRREGFDIEGTLGDEAPLVG